MAASNTRTKRPLSNRSDEIMNSSVFVTITNENFNGDQDSIIAEAIDSMGGFSLVLAAAKAWLEHKLDLKLIIDRAPEAHVATTENH